MSKQMVLVLGAAGMLGNAVLKLFSSSDGFDVVGTVRSSGSIPLFPSGLQEKLISGVDVTSGDSLLALFGRVQPDIVINCVGIVKQLAEAEDPLVAIPINALLPHRLAQLCSAFGARLVHMSTDCVFSGSKGMYVEGDFPDANDLYGRSKYLGEVDYPHAITLRTSIIGHELSGSHSLINWFLGQQGPVRGFKRAIFSGLPTVEIARIIRDYVIPSQGLHGLYHVSAEPISKFDLLHLVARVYGKNIIIIPDKDCVIDRSLDSSHFRSITGYLPSSWNKLIESMRESL